MRYHWLSKKVLTSYSLWGSICYVAAQLSLDLCDWKPKGSRMVKLPFIKYRIRWYYK